MKIDNNQWKWTRKPKDFTISEDKIEVITNPHTDLWQRTYYHFRNDNAPVLQIKTSKKMFSFIVIAVASPPPPASALIPANRAFRPAENVLGTAV